MIDDPSTGAYPTQVGDAAGKDPVAFRLARLGNDPRKAGVLKLAAEKAQREKEREDAKLAKEAERAKAEADKRAATEAAMAKKNKQKNQFASFFAKAAKKTPEPEAAVVAPPGCSRYRAC